MLSFFKETEATCALVGCLQKAYIVNQRLVAVYEDRRLGTSPETMEKTRVPQQAM